MNFLNWPIHDGQTIKLYTLEEFEKLPDGTQVISLFGELRLKTSELSRDTRGGYVGYGSLNA